MIVVADSGSTKTAWSFLFEKQYKTTLTAGINPFLQSEAEIRCEIAKVLSSCVVEAVYFYGAGCTPEKSIVMHEIIKEIVPDAYVQVDSDLLAAARSLCQTKPGIACILGTGSNSCFYDGNYIANQVSPLGFILGDEGSGAYLGKRLVGDVLKNQLPKAICDAFKEEYKLKPATIIESVYRQPYPNRFLASFAPFLSKHKNHPDIRLLISDSFRCFLERNVMQYDYRNEPIHFTGSIAWHFSEILNDVVMHLGMKLGQITSSPTEGLIAYHSNNNICSKK